MYFLSSMKVSYMPSYVSVDDLERCIESFAHNDNRHCRNRLSSGTWNVVMAFQDIAAIEWSPVAADFTSNSQWMHTLRQSSNFTTSVDTSILWARPSPDDVLEYGVTTPVRYDHIAVVRRVNQAIDWWKLAGHWRIETPAALCFLLALTMLIAFMSELMRTSSERNSAWRYFGLMIPGFDTISLKHMDGISRRVVFFSLCVMHLLVVAHYESFLAESLMLVPTNANHDSVDTLAHAVRSGQQRLFSDSNSSVFIDAIRASGTNFNKEIKAAISQHGLGVEADKFRAIARVLKDDIAFTGSYNSIMDAVAKLDGDDCVRLTISKWPGVSSFPASILVNRRADNGADLLETLNYNIIDRYSLMTEMPAMRSEQCRKYLFEASGTVTKYTPLSIRDAAGGVAFVLIMSAAGIVVLVIEIVHKRMCSKSHDEALHADRRLVEVGNGPSSSCEVTEDRLMTLNVAYTNANDSVERDFLDYMSYLGCQLVGNNDELDH